MKRYETYKDSGIEWIGKVPEHWKVRKLSYQFNVNTGFTPPTGNNEYYENGTNDWITISDLNEKYVSESSTKLTDLAVEGKEIIPKGSLLYSFKLSVGKMAFAKKDIYTNEAIFAIYPDKNINLNYYYYLLGSILIHNSNKNIYGANILNQELIRASKLVVPKSEEQTQIANFLDQKTTQIDELITKKEQLIQLLEEERSAIINQAVTKGLNPDIPMKDSGINWLGEIPEHWELKKLKYLFDVISSKTDIRPDYLVALENIESWTGNVSGSYDKDDFEGTVNLFEKGDILFNKLRPYLAKVVLTDKDGGAVSELLVLRSKNNINSKYMFYRMISEMMISVIDGSTYGAKMPRANWNSFISELKIGIPNINEQNHIVEYLDQKLNNIKQTSSKILLEIEYLKEYKESLISNVVTGKIDVREEVLN